MAPTKCLKQKHSHFDYVYKSMEDLYEDQVLSLLTWEWRIKKKKGMVSYRIWTLSMEATEKELEQPRMPRNVPAPTFSSETTLKVET